MSKIRVLDGITYDISDEFQKKEYQKHYQRIYTKNYRERHRETCLAYRREYYNTHKEQYIAYRNKYQNDMADEKKDLKRVKNAISNFIKYNYNTDFQEQKKKETLRFYYSKKEVTGTVRVCFD